MFTKFNFRYLFSMAFTVPLILAACQATGGQETPEPVVETVVVMEVVQAAPVEVIQVATLTPEPAGPRTLVICLHEEPRSLNYIYGVDFQKFYQEAIFDGPIDNNSFAFQPVILEKLPSLGDGDAVLTQVIVSEGDIVVDAKGDLVTLDSVIDPPIMLTPTSGGDPVPYQGGDFEMDQLSATFKFLPGLLWSDGEPLTSADSVYTFNLAADPDSDFDKRVIERTSSYEAIDEVTIQWTGIPGFLEGFYSEYMFGPIPEHIWSQYSPAGIQEPEELSHYPVGWGPYMVDEWVEGESINLVKNPHYFRADEGLPKFNRLIFRFTGTNANANIASLLAGECDLLWVPLYDQIDLLLELYAAGKLKATFSTDTVWEHIDFGIQHLDYDDGYKLGVDRPDFFSDVRTRQAFALCMDRQTVVDLVFFGQSLVPDSFLPPQHPLFNPDLVHYDFDVAAGSALLEEIGWVDEDGNPETPRVAQGIPNVPDGTPLEVAYETTNEFIRPQTTSIIKDSLAQCGIKANIQLYNYSEWLADGPEGKLFGRRYDLGQFAWITGPKPACDIYLSSQTTGPAGAKFISIQDGLERTFSEDGWWGWNQIGFANEEYDRACQTALNSLPWQPEYETALREAQRIFAEQLPTVPLALYTKLTATRPDICGVIMDPTAFSEFWNIEEFDYGEGCVE